MRKYRMNTGNKSKRTLSLKSDDVTNKVSIETFLEVNNNNTIPGEEKSATKTRFNRQYRLLNDKRHEIINESSSSKTSFEFPIPNENIPSENTSFCIIHANMNLAFENLKRFKITNATSPTALIKMICCGGYSNKNCLSRTCTSCKHKQIPLNSFDGDEIIFCDRWVDNMPTGTKKTHKETFKMTKTCFVNMFLKVNLPEYMQHVLNIIHQYRTVNKIRQDLAPCEALLHVGSYLEVNPKISLHTAVLYLRNDFENPVQSFCCLSQNLRYDTILLCAHLTPILEVMKRKIPLFNTIHFQSNSCNQHRNKDIFFMIATYFSEVVPVDNIYWHYSEVGHGFGVPDSIGECVKRALNVVSEQERCFKKIISRLQQNCPGINIIPVDDKHVKSISTILNTSLTQPFENVLSIRQVAWSKNNPHLIRARRLSCSECQSDQICTHFEIGLIHIFRKDHSLNSNKNSSSSVSIGSASKNEERFEDEPSHSKLSTTPQTVRLVWKHPELIEKTMFR